MKQFKRLLAALLCAALLPVSAWAAEPAKTRERQEDLDFLVTTLAEKHPNFYANTTKEAVAAKKAAIEAELDTLSDFDFAIKLSELTAMGGDSHTMLAVGNALGAEAKMLAMVPKWYDGRWTLTGGPTQLQPYIGQEIIAVNGYSMDELQRRLSPMISYDNETRLRGQFGQMVYVADVLSHYGIINADAKTVPVTVRDDAGKETVLDIPCMTQQAVSALGENEWISRDKLRKAVPATEPADAYYKLLDLGGGALYMQYNRCAEAPDLPMADFAAAVREKLDSGAYTKFLIDLRNNGGGSDGVLNPIVYQAQHFLAKGGAVYALAGERTFSSALINTVQLKDIGAVFVGEPTGGSVDHFGSVTGFELPNSKLRGQYSNKFIEMGGYYEAAKPYGVESFPPDIEVAQKFTDYLDGIDTAVQYVLDNAPITATQTAEAKVSSARVVVDGKPVAAAAYEIADSNYFKLRDLAMAFAGTGSAFNVRWDGDAKSVTLLNGVYKPDGSELKPLPAGAQTARRATADVYVEDGEMSMPLVGKAYEIAGHHYFKLRDLSNVLGLRIEWDGKTQTISISTPAS
ncbi:stalk domain-containing protein [Agathobaculum sp.]|uniref:stalk domain-containing protein n=1 Tax=Agathobaculum sp. TaxID=2048138 RepID=UPI002A7FDA45|nr:stalk domain-containing protein [Agathobaculum sp.]MCI5704030.1 stalk domain-containing protein [Pseudoflavonifractor sp.]MDY3618910.1 stalk domain-containing protein [Agathobaculum sp.]